MVILHHFKYSKTHCSTIFLCPNGHEKCHINPSGYQWFDLTKDDPKYILVEAKKAENKKLIEIIGKSNDIRSMTVDEYEIYIDDYIKKSKIPDINEWIKI